MSKPAAPAAAPKAKKGGMIKWIILAVVIICSVGAGLLAPRLIAGTPLFGGGEATKVETPRAKIPFGEVVVNLNVDRHTRYLRVKLVCVVKGEAEKEMTEKITNKKTEMRSWLISHLRDKSLEDLAGSTGFNRLRREILQEFNEMVESKSDGKPGSEPIQEVLLEEFVIQ